MKFFTICVSIFAVLNLGLAPAYAQNRPEKIIQNNSTLRTPTKLDFFKFFNSFDAHAADTDTGKEKEKGEEDAKNKLKEEGVDVTEYTDDNTSIALTSVLMLVIGFFAPAFAISCPNSPDVWIHLIAGVIMVVLEGVFWGLYEKGSTKELELVEEKKSEYSTQLNSFSAAMEITKKAQTWMNAKFGTQVAVAVILGVSAAVVIIMSIIATVSSLGTRAAVAEACPVSATTEFTPLNKFDPGALYSESRKNFNFPLPIDETVKRMKKAKNIGELAFINEEVKKWNLGEIKSQDFKDYQAISQDKELNSLINGSEKLTLDFASLANILIAPAIATETESATPTGDTSDTAKDLAGKLASLGIGTVGGIVAGAIVAAKGMQKVSAINGWIRGAVYLVEMSFAIAISVFSKRTADQLGERADAYQKLYDKLADIMANPASKDEIPHVPIPSTSLMAGASSAAAQELDGHCFKDDGKSGASADPGCGCKANKSCKKTKMPPMQFPNFKTPGALASSARLSEQMSNQVYSGDMSGAGLSAQALGKNAVAVKKMNESLMALANKKLVEYGKSPMDFKKMQSDYKNQAMGTMRNAFNSLSDVDQSAFMKGAVPGSDKKAEKGDEEVVASAGPSGKSGSGSSGKKGSKKGIFDFLKKSDKEEGLNAASNKDVPGEGESLDDYVDSSKQITEDGRRTLFKIIEIRYMKSAYPVFFKEKE